MPYISEEEKRRFEFWTEARKPFDYTTPGVKPGAFGRLCSTPGQLNYVLTQVILAYLTRQQADSAAYVRDPHYADYNEVMGVLESAKLELYRRMIALYEDRKIEENGDVYS